MVLVNKSSSIHMSRCLKYWTKSFPCLSIYLDDVDCDLWVFAENLFRRVLYKSVTEVAVHVLHKTTVIVHNSLILKAHF